MTLKIQFGEVEIDNSSLKSLDPSGNISLVPAGSGAVNLGNVSYPTTAGLSGQGLKWESGGNLAWDVFASSGTQSSTLVGLSDVSLASPSNGQVLTYNSTDSKWENTAPGSLSVTNASASGTPILNSYSSGTLSLKTLTSGNNISLSETNGVITITGSATPLPAGSNYQVLATPNDGSYGTAALRALIAADIPSLTFSKITGIVPLSQGGTGTDLSSGSHTAGLIYRSSGTGSALVADPSTGGTYLGWNGSSFAWTTPSYSGAQNLVLATPNGSSGVASLRALVAADISAVNASAIVGQVALANGGTGSDLSTGTHTAAIMYRSSATGSSLISDPSSSNTYLEWNGSTFIWATPTFSQPAGSNYQVLATPNDGSYGTSALRQLVANDIPNLDASKITTGQLTFARGGTGSDLSAGTHTAAIMYRSSATGSALISDPTTSGTYLSWNGSSFAWATPTVSMPTGSQNLVLATPNGSSGTASLRALVAADIPSLSYVTNVGIALPNIFTTSGTPVTSIGTLTAVLATTTANTVFAGPNGSGGTPSFRLLVAADIPTHSATLLSGQVALANGGTGTDLSSGTHTAGLIYRSSATQCSMVADPTTSGTYLEWNGSNLVWATPSGGSGGVKLQQFGGTSTPTESTINFTSTSIGVQGTYVNNIITVTDQGSGLAQVNIMPQLFRVRLKLNYSTSSPYVPIWTNPITPVSGWSIPSGWSLIQVPSGLSNDIQFMFGSGWVYPYVTYTTFGNATGVNPPSGNSATHAWEQRANSASSWDVVWYDNDTTVLQVFSATISGAGGANGTPNVIMDLWFANFN